MIHQLTFADSEFSQKRRKTRKEIFLGRMDNLIPWKRLEKIITPHYPKAGKGRRPYPLSAMLRIHCMQNWYSLSDPAMEDALYEIASMRLFAGLSLDKAIPDHTTIMNFRHLLERKGLTRKLFKEVNQWLTEAGVLLKEGTLVDATIIEAPTSTKNKTGERDPEIHQTKKGNEWHFGLKAHIGVEPVRESHIVSPQLPRMNMTSIKRVISCTETKILFLLMRDTEVQKNVQSYRRLKLIGTLQSAQERFASSRNTLESIR
mgnify:CR=1 FL=1